MSQKPKKADKIKFKYIFPDDYAPSYVTGLTGGLSPTGEIVVSFFHERGALPKESIVQLDKEGRLGDEVDSDPKDYQTTIIRSVMSGIVLNVKTAELVSEWLNETIATAKERSSAEEKPTVLEE